MWINVLDGSLSVNAVQLCSSGESPTHLSYAAAATSRSFCGAARAQCLSSSGNEDAEWFYCLHRKTHRSLGRLTIVRKLDRWAEQGVVIVQVVIPYDSQLGVAAAPAGELKQALCVARWRRLKVIGVSRQRQEQRWVRLWRRLMNGSCPWEHGRLLLEAVGDTHFLWMS